ncbi:MAG: efflux RND transporter periplasmic adaptor subunit [Prolixibacteraceae bacterium]|nr:efflux RND transporter periplasmic adaptor subunit [Prolixibacteraceae bacterium]
MKNIRNILMLAALAAIFGCSNNQQSESADLATPVSVEDVKFQSIEQYESTTGTAKSTHEVTLSTEMAGIYKIATNPATGRPFKLGDKVKAGQVIILIEDNEYEYGIGIESQKLNREISEQEYEKQKSLYEKGGVTLRELRNAEVSATTAKYNYESALIRLSKMKITAPFAGIIVDLPYYTQGTRVSSGSQVVSLMSYESMFMEINLPEKSLANISTGLNVLITSYTLTNDTLKGSIAQLSPAISTETRTFKGIISISNPELKLRPGMFVKADIVVARRDSAIVVPKNMLLSSGRGKMVFVVDQSTALERRLTTGIENQEYVEVIDGLKVNDRLVVKGYETLRNNSKVKIIR